MQLVFFCRHAQGAEIVQPMGMSFHVPSSEESIGDPLQLKLPPCEGGLVERCGGDSPVDEVG